MNSLWTKLYDRFKDRRYGYYFLIFLLAFLGLAALRAALDSLGLGPYSSWVLLAAGLLVAGWIAASLWRARERRWEHQSFPPLSSDEKRVARSKLVKERNGEKV
jgi:membrane protein implicated in regulation of membrane protease activity